MNISIFAAAEALSREPVPRENDPAVLKEETLFDARVG